MRFGQADHGDHQGRIGEPALLDIDLSRRGLRILPREHVRDHVAGADAGVALEHNETPWRQLAVIRYPRTDGQNGLKFGGRGAGSSHLARFDRASDLEQFNGVGHWGLSFAFSDRVACSYVDREAVQPRLE